MMVFVGFRPWIGYGGTTSNTDELCGFGVQGVTTDLAARGTCTQQHEGSAPEFDGGCNATGCRFGGYNIGGPESVSDFSVPTRAGRSFGQRLYTTVDHKHEEDIYH